MKKAAAAAAAHHNRGVGERARPRRRRQGQRARDVVGFGHVNCRVILFVGDVDVDVVAAEDVTHGG